MTMTAIPALPPEQLPEYYMKNSDKKASSKNKIETQIETVAIGKSNYGSDESYVPSQNRPCTADMQDGFFK